MMNFTINGTNTTTVLPRRPPPPPQVHPICLERPEKYLSEVVILGYISPVMVPFIVALNTTMVWIFWTKKFRSPTHVIMTGIALADVLNAISVLPWTIHFFSLGNSKDCVPQSWCLTYFILRHILPEMFHNASKWLTVFLALERLIVVTFPMRAKTICSMRNATIVVLSTFVFNVPLFSYRFIQTELSSKTVISQIYTNKTFEACVLLKTEETGVKTALIVAIQLLPACLLIIFNSALILQLKRIAAWRKGIFRDNNDKTKEDRTVVLSRTVFYVILAILCTEIPVGIITLLAAYGSSSKQFFRRQIFAYFHLIIIVMYPSNFVVYNVSSEEFRKSLKQLFACRMIKESGKLAIEESNRSETDSSHHT